MGRVSPLDGIRYSRQILGYLLGVYIFGLLWMVLGIVMFDQNQPVLGVILLLVGISMMSLGFGAMGYKIIADAVATGMENANITPAAQKVDMTGTAPTATKVEDESGTPD